MSFPKMDTSIIFKTTENSRRGETHSLEDILTKDIDGLIIEPSKSEIVCRHPKLYDESLINMKFPTFFIHGVYERDERQTPHSMDDCKGGYLLYKYLIDMGHQHIVGVFKADDHQGRERHKGYVMALQEAGYQYDPDMVVLVSYRRSSDETSNIGCSDDKGSKKMRCSCLLQ